MILYGALSTLDGSELIGFALALQAPDRHALGAGWLRPSAGFVADIHDWEFGGRR